MAGALIDVNEMMYIVFLIVGLVGGIILKKVLEKITLVKLRKGGYFQIFLLDAGKILRKFYARPENGSVTINFGGKEKSYLFDPHSDVGHTAEDNLPVVIGAVNDTLLTDINSFLNSLDQAQRDSIKDEIDKIQAKLGNKIIPINITNRAASLAPEQFADQINITTRLATKIGGAIKEKLTPMNILILMLIGVTAAIGVMTYTSLQSITPAIQHLNALLAAKAP